MSNTEILTNVFLGIAIVASLFSIGFTLWGMKK